MSEAGAPRSRPGSERGRHVSEYVRLQRWEILPPADDGAPAALGGRIPVDDHLRSAAGGLSIGVLLTGIDSLGGLVCGLAVQPQWIVTTNLMVRVARLSHVGPLRLHARVVRKGRKSAVGALDVVDEGVADAPVATAIVTCAILDPGDMDLAFAHPFDTPMPSPDPDPPDPETFFCIEPGVGPITRLELADHLRNPWGILHGGAVATLADIAAVRTVAGERAGPVAASDTVLHFLQPVRIGPVEARCRIIGTRSGGTVVRVAVHDIGADDRRVALASVTVRDVT